MTSVELDFLDLTNFNLVSIYPWLIGLAAILVAVVLVYLLWYKARVQMPLQNERSLGWLQIYLPKGFGLHAGYATTAKPTLQKQTTQLVENETDGTVKEQLKKTHKILDYFHPIAHKVGRQNFIYLFDANPQDQRFMDVDPDHNDSYIIHGAQDVVSAGEWNGFQFLAVKLDPETRSFNRAEDRVVEAGLGIVKYLKHAAKNVEKIHDLKEEVNYLKTDRDKARQEVAKVRSDLDRALSALSNKPLSVSDDVKVTGAWRSKAKEWFWSSPWQIATALAGYFSAPYIQSFLETWQKIRLTPPTTTYFAAAVTVIGFFIIPVGKKLLGRWL